jgi:hypothetical protein
MPQNEQLRTTASSNAVLGLARRLQAAENLREQLLIHRDSIAAQPQGYGSPSIGVGSGPGPQGDVALAPGTFGNSSYGASSPRGYSFGTVGQGRPVVSSSRGVQSCPPAVDPDATPRPRPATLQPPQQQNQQQQTQQQVPQQQLTLTTTDSKHNTDYLPMFIENIVYEHMQHKNNETLRPW